MKDNKSKPKSRRQFLEESAKVGAGLLLTGCTTWDRVTASVDSDKYEFIIVGAGAGGGTLAARLALLDHKVLLLEAGSDKVDSYYKTPAFQGLATENPETSWKFFVQHYLNQQRNLKDSKYEKSNGGVFYPRASGLGGCTTHHAMITMYPEESDWQKIADLSRVDSGSGKGWTPFEMRKHFVKLEDNRYLDSNSARRWGYGPRGKGGWLSTEKSPLSLAFSDLLFTSIVEASASYDGSWSGLWNVDGYLNELGRILGVLNLDVALDTNRLMPVKTEGVYQPTKATRDGRRRGPREWLLETAQTKKNLTIIPNAFVTQLLFDQDVKNKVVGVQYREGQYLYEASAKNSQKSFKGSAPVEVRAKEVILSGGAFNTPQILMLSGIGDFNELPANVPRRVNLPGVGKNLQDRYEIGVVCRLNKPIDAIKNCKFVADSSDPCFDPKLFSMDESKPQPDASDALYSTNGVIIGHIKKSSAARSRDPDLFVFSAPGAFKGYESGWSRKSLQPDHFTWAVLKAHTKNSGYVKLKTGDPYKPADPFQRPEINFNYFSQGKDDPDLQAVVEGVQLARKINNTSPLKDMIVEEVLPGYELEGDDLKEFVLNEAWGHHASCTAKMGHKNDPMAVVDFEFKVRGVQGLRIVDASVFPEIPGMFIVVPIYMIAEKAAEDIHKAHS